MEEFLKVVLHSVVCLDAKAGHQRIQGCIGLHASCVHIEFFTPDQSSLLALLDHHVKETAEDVQAVASPDAREAGMIWQGFV